MGFLEYLSHLLRPFRPWPKFEVGHVVLIDASINREQEHLLFINDLRRLRPNGREAFPKTWVYDGDIFKVEDNDLVHQGRGSYPEDALTLFYNPFAPFA